MVLLDGVVVVRLTSALPGTADEADTAASRDLENHTSDTSPEPSGNLSEYVLASGRNCKSLELLAYTADTVELSAAWDLVSPKSVQTASCPVLRT